MCEVGHFLTSCKILEEYTMSGVPTKQTKNKGDWEGVSVEIYNEVLV